MAHLHVHTEPIKKAIDLANPDHSHKGHHFHVGRPDNVSVLKLAIFLNLTFVVVELIFGWYANSTALIADAGHNLSDVMGLLLAWLAEYLMRKTPNERYTYGLRQASILVTLFNALLLMLACGVIVWEAVQRFLNPQPVASGWMIAVALVGIFINGLSAWLFSRSDKRDLNMRGAYLHMLADAAVSLSVVVAGVVLLYWPVTWLDPLVSLVIVVVIVASTWGLLLDSMRLALNAVPRHVVPNDVAQYLLQCEGVVHVHDLHIWAISTTETALTVHLVMPQGCPNDAFLDAVALGLKQRFAIEHSTLQVETSTRYHDAPLYMI